MISDQASGMDYDPEARRDTPLALRLKERIRRRGPISVGAFMQACLHDPELGYYRARQAIGASGDFITAPEISQVFGELIGLWCVVVWQQMGAPAPFNLIELGPGRGTMLADALRAAGRVPAFRTAARITLIETSPVLRAAQADTLRPCGAVVEWRPSIEAMWQADPACRARPAIVLANELLDTLSVDLLVRRGNGWHARLVAVDDRGRLVFVDPAGPSDPGNGRPPRAEALARCYPSARDGDIVTWCRHDLVERDLAPWPMLAGLFIDYGHTSRALGDTLQAVRGSTFEHPLTSPGEADLSAQVDFAAFVERLEACGLLADGPVTQARFLGSLGIAERTSRLMAANPDQATAIEAGTARLMAPAGMGSRFKAVGVRSPSLPPLPGFPACEDRL